MVNFQTSVFQNVFNILEEKNMSLDEFIKKLNMDKFEFTMLMNCDANISLALIKQMAKELDTSFENLMNRVGEVTYTVFKSSKEKTKYKKELKEYRDKKRNERVDFKDFKKEREFKTEEEDTKC